MKPKRRKHQAVPTCKPYGKIIHRRIVVRTGEGRIVKPCPINFPLCDASNPCPRHKGKA